SFLSCCLSSSVSLHSLLLPFPSSRLSRPPLPTLFPYTTLFRSPPARLSGLVDVGVVQAELELEAKVPDRVVEPLRDGVALRHDRSEEHTSELQSRVDLVCRLLLEKKKKNSKKEQ